MIEYLLTVPFYIWSSYIIVFLLIILFLFVRHGMKKIKVGDKPGKFLTIFIVLVEFMNQYVKNNIGKHWRFVAPLVLGLGVFIFASNISGLFLLDTPTKYTTVTFAFSLVTLFIIQVTGIKSRRWRHLQTLVGPMPWMSPIMVPLNLLSDLMPMISMTVRLFGNIASGAAMMTLVYTFGSWASIFIAPPLHLLFDLGFGLIQTIVFVLLTIVFTSNKIEESDFIIEGGKNNV